MTGRPLPAACLCLIVGAALGAWLPQEAGAWGWAAAAAAALWAGALAGRSAATASRLGAVTFAAVGAFLMQADLRPLYRGGPRILEGDVQAAGRVVAPVEHRAGETLLRLAPVRLQRAGSVLALRRPLLVVVGGELPGVEPGDLVTARGRFAPLRGDRNLGWFPASVGSDAGGRLSVSSAIWVRRDGHLAGRGPNAAVLRWRAAADAFWGSLPGAGPPLLNALTTGVRSGIPAQLAEDFRRAGLSHLLAISGMNVGVLTGIVYGALRLALALCSALVLRLPVQPLAAALTLPAVWFFMLFSGSDVPVQRAAWAGAAALVGIALWRRAQPPEAIALAAAAIIIASPRALLSASLQLSFAAVVGLLLVAPRLREAEAGTAADAGLWARPWRAARALFVGSLAASAATAPLVAFHFQEVSLVGPVANLFAVPYSGLVVLPAGWAALGARALGLPGAGGVAAAAAWLASRLAEYAAFCAAPRWAAQDCARPPLALTLCLLALAVVVLAPPAPWRRAAVPAACASAALAASAWAVQTHGAGLRLVALDVGQGLSCALLLPGGGSLLFDAGPRWPGYDAGERVAVPALRRLGVARLDALAISHEHPDHAGGERAVVAALRPRRVLRGGAAGAARGGELRVAGEPVVVLNPPEDAPQGDANERSLAIAVRWRETAVVLTGDAGPRVAAGIVRAAEAAGASAGEVVLQAPHHGGSEAACRALADALRPRLSVISVGRNGFGHPRAGAVAALERHGRALRTDRDGAVFVSSDGERLRVRTWRELALGRTLAERVRWLVAGW